MDFFPGLRAMENLHPVFVHAPVTLLPLALVFQALAVWRGREEWQKLALWLLWLGALGALAAVGTGLLAGLLVLNGVLVVGADLGARLVYEFGVSVKQAEED